MENWAEAEQCLSNISISSNSNNAPVSIQGYSDHLRCIGIGTDAAVFQCIDVPTFAFKMYANDKISKVSVEEHVYKTLGDSPYFSTCFDSKDNYLVLNFEEGITLYDCLVQGVPIPDQVIKDVQNAREYVRQKGLNPRDIHLKNILLQNGRAKIIDVSEYAFSGDDLRWEHLNKGYEQYYHLIKGKPVPLFIIETIQKWYYQRVGRFETFEDFMNNSLKFLSMLRK